jgi:hypothetical protein
MPAELLVPYGNFQERDFAGTKSQNAVFALIKGSAYASPT